MHQDQDHLEWKSIISPPKLALIFGGGGFLMMIIAGLVGNTLNVWLVSASMLLLFSVLVNIQSLLVPNFKEYTKKAMYSFVITFIALGLLSRLVSGISVFDAGSYRTIYIVILVSYFFFLAIIMFIKGVIGFLLEKDDKVK